MGEAAFIPSKLPVGTTPNNTSGHTSGLPPTFDRVAADIRVPLDPGGQCAVFPLSLFT